jgi:antitoxin MazE
MYIRGGPTVQARVQKWGNSLGVRIPRSFARAVGIDAGTAVDWSIENGKLILSRLATRSLRLEDLLRDVTPQNVHAEVVTGPPRGHETW